MRIYSAQGPDGRIYEFEGPDGISEDAVLSAVRRQIASQPPAPNPQSGFMPAAKAGLASLKSDIATLAGRTGLMDEAAANKYIKEQEEYKQKTFKPTETFGEAPITKTLELFGGSLPYMAAPVVAGIGALALPEAAIAAPIAAGLTSAAQFTGSNLSRQMAEGKTLGETELGSAALASIPQAALDVFAFRLLPGIRGIFAAAGKEIPEKVLLDATKQSVGKVAADYTLATGRAASMEGLTEAGQQVLERLQAGLAINDEKARSEYFDSFVAGAVLGGTLAPAGRYVERAGEQGKQRAAQRAESKRLADEARGIQALEDAKAQEQLAAVQRRENAMERARNMPGFTGVTDPNVELLSAARDQREAEAAALEQARLAKIEEVQATDFHADPLENQRRKTAELAKLGEIPEAQEPAPPIEVITPEQQAQMKADEIQGRAAEMPSFTGGPGGINDLMMRNVRESQADQERQQKVDLQAKVDEIRNTDYSSDPMQNALLQQKEFEKLGFMPYVPIETQLGMTPEGKEPAAPKVAAPKDVSKAQLPITEAPIAEVKPAAPPDVQEAIDYRKQQDAIETAAAEEKKSKFEGFKRTLTPQEWADIGVAPKAEKVVIDRTSNPDNIGINAEPITSGGKPFATRTEAIEVKNNFKPADAPKDARPVKLDNYMVIKGKEGYVLSPKLAEDYERQKKAGRRLSGISTDGREYMTSLEAIASAGGLRPEIANETPYMNQNPRIGGKFLFRKDGLTLERAAEMLMQDGYPLPENYTVNDVLDLVNNPKLTPQGNEAFYEAERKAQEQDRNLAELNEDAYLPTFEEFGYEEVDIEAAGLDKVSPKLQAEVRAIIAEAESMGIDLDEMIGKIYDEKFKQGPNVYYRAAIDAVNEVLSSRRGAVSEAVGSETKAPTRPEAEEKVKPEIKSEKLADLLDQEGFERLHVPRAKEQTNPRVYVDKGGQWHPTWEKDGVRLSLGQGKVIYAEPGKRDVGVFQGNPEDIVIESLIVDPAARKQAKAAAALKTLIDIADKKGQTLYVEPTPLEAGAMDFAQLVSFYKKAGFEQQESGYDKVLVRKPATEEFKLETETADEVRAKQAEAEKRATAEEKAFKEEEARAKADAEVGEFTLTGSNRPADVAAAQGQEDIFSIPKEKKPEPKAEKALPPELPIPDDYKPIRGRHPQVVMAARELAAGRINKAQYDKYVDTYKPIAKVPNPEPPLTTDGMAKVLNTAQREKINPVIPAGTKVGLRMDINALRRGEKLGLNGSVVAIHPENDPSSPIGYASAAHITDVQFVIRSEKGAMRIAMGQDTKKPQQTAEGTLVSSSPGKVYADVMKHLADPAWTQVSLDPLRHSFFYDRETKKPVLSADEVFQIGRFLLAKNVKFGEREDFMYMKDVIERKGTDAQIQRKDDMVSFYGGDVIYQDGDIGVYRMFNNNYEIIYRAFAKNDRLKVDIEDYTGKIFSAKEKAQLKDAVDKWKAEDKARYKNDPFVKFDKDGIDYSQSISPEIAA